MAAAAWLTRTNTRGVSRARNNTTLPLRQTHQMVAAVNMPTSRAVASTAEGVDTSITGDSRAVTRTGDIGLKEVEDDG